MQLYNELVGHLLSEVNSRDSEIASKLNKDPILKDDVDVIKANLNYVEAMISSDKFDKHFEKIFYRNHR